jgi:hypothetical protein
MRLAVRNALTALVISLVLIVVHGSFGRQVPIEVHLAIVGGLALVSVVRAVSDRCDARAWRSPALVARRRRPPAGPVPDGLGEWIGLVSTATEDGRAAAARFGPRLARLAGDRLAARRGIDADADRPAAEAALGPVASRLAWPAVVPDRWSGGIAIGDVSTAAGAIEDLG